MKRFGSLLGLFIAGAVSVSAEDFTIDRVTYRDAAWISTNAANATLRHATGIVTFRLSTLSKDLQTALKYDAGMASNYLAKAAAQQALIARQQADAARHKQQLASAVQWQGEISAREGNTLLLNAQRGNDERTITSLILVGHPRAKALGVNEDISFLAYRDGTQLFRQGSETYACWIYVGEKAAVPPPPPPQYVAPTRLPPVDRFSRTGMFPTRSQ